jgi:succinate-semialdehyde dehydrogenase/glutarate-semialdehyde dehydrogenase
VSEKDSYEVSERRQLLIGGKWVDGAGAESIPVHSPATGELLAEVPMGIAEDVDKAVEAARGARHEMAVMGPFQRAELLHAIADLISERREEIARDLAREQGKPYHSEAIGEVGIAVEMWRDAAEIIKRLEGEVVPSSDPRKRIITIRQPRGVYGVITPWNFPATIPTEYLCAGLAAGNTIVWKPSELTPLTALHLARAMDDAGVPPGTINVVTGDGPTVGEAIVSHPEVDAVGATGSPQTGDRIARAAGAKPVLLELGGNCPAIVFADADLEFAIQRMISGCFANAGQICDSTERIIVHESLHDRVVEGLVKGAEAVKLGLSLDPETTMGPLNNENTAAKVDRHLADAVDAGASVLAGGSRDDDRPTRLYYRPTVVDGVEPGMQIFREETFGPVASVTTFSEVDEAISLANDSELGLVAGVFTNDPQLAAYTGERLEAGIVNLNDIPTYWQPHTAFGGYTGKKSGVGRLGGKYTILEMSQIKTLVYDARLGGPG